MALVGRVREGTSWRDGSPEKKEEKTRSLTSIVLDVDKRVHFRKQPPTLLPTSNVLVTLGSTISLAPDSLHHGRAGQREKRSAEWLLSDYSDTLVVQRSASI